MNYINRPKECYTQEEWIEYLEEGIRELRKDKKNLKKEKGEIRQRLVALEKNLETLSRVKENKELREENKKLKSDLAFERTMLDNVKAEYKSQVNIIKKLKAELSKYKKQYQHSMWDDEWKKRETVYVRNSKWDYVESQIWDRRFMEEDTLQELRDIGEI